jgi:hypothetical protein
VRDESLPILAAAGDIFWVVVWTLWAATSAVFLIWSGYSGDKKSSWWGASFVGSCIVAAFFFRRLV